MKKGTKKYNCEIVLTIKTTFDGEFQSYPLKFEDAWVLADVIEQAPGDLEDKLLKLLEDIIDGPICAQAKRTDPEPPEFQKEVRDYVAKLTGGR